VLEMTEIKMKKNAEKQQIILVTNGTPNLYKRYNNYLANWIISYNINNVKDTPNSMLTYTYYFIIYIIYYILYKATHILDKQYLYYNNY
jgi:hypothetical protein